MFTSAQMQIERLSDNSKAYNVVLFDSTGTQDAVSIECINYMAANALLDVLHKATNLHVVG